MEGNVEMFLPAAAIFFFAEPVHGTMGHGFPMISAPLFVLFTDVQAANLPCHRFYIS